MQSPPETKQGPRQLTANAEASWGYGHIAPTLKSPGAPGYSESNYTHAHWPSEQVPVQTGMNTGKAGLFEGARALCEREPRTAAG